MPIVNKLNISSEIVWEKKEGINNNSEFSFFYTDKKYSPNYYFDGYKNNHISFELNYNGGSSFQKKKDQEFEKGMKGSNYLGITAKFSLWDKKMLNSSEDIFSYEISSKIYFEPFNPVSVDISCAYFDINQSKHISQYRFTNKNNMVATTEAYLPFYTLNDYQFTLSKYFYGRTKIKFFDIPKMLNFKPSFTGILSYLQSFEKTEAALFQTLEGDYFEYGLGLTDVSLFDFYIIKNSESGAWVFRMDMNY